MSPIPGPIPLSYQIFDCNNKKFQYYTFDIPEYRDIRDKEGKLLTQISLYADDEEDALRKCEIYIQKLRLDDE